MKGGDIPKIYLGDKYMRYILGMYGGRICSDSVLPVWAKFGEESENKIFEGGMKIG